jgi:hypothetical protein
MRRMGFEPTIEVFQRVKKRGQYDRLERNVVFAEMLSSESDVDSKMVIRKLLFADSNFRARD